MEMFGVGYSQMFLQDDCEFSTCNGLPWQLLISSSVYLDQTRNEIVLSELRSHGATMLKDLQLTGKQKEAYAYFVAQMTTDNTLWLDKSSWM